MFILRLDDFEIERFISDIYLDFVCGSSLRLVLAYARVEPSEL